MHRADRGTGCTAICLGWLGRDTQCVKNNFWLIIVVSRLFWEHISLKCTRIEGGANQMFVFSPPPPGSLFHRQSLCILHLHSYDPHHSTRSRQVDVSLKRLPGSQQMETFTLSLCLFTSTPPSFFFLTAKLSSHAWRFRRAVAAQLKWAARFSYVVFPCQCVSCSTDDIHCYATALHCFSTLQRRGEGSSVWFNNQVHFSWKDLIPSFSSLFVCFWEQWSSCS